MPCFWNEGFTTTSYNSHLLVERICCDFFIKAVPIIFSSTEATSAMRFPTSISAMFSRTRSFTSSGVFPEKNYGGWVKRVDEELHDLPYSTLKISHDCFEAVTCILSTGCTLRRHIDYRKPFFLFVFPHPISTITETYI